MRYSGAYSGGTSFTIPISDTSVSRGSIGSFTADFSYSNYTASSIGTAFQPHSDLPLEGYDLEARIFQDLDGDKLYSPGADRLLAKSDAATRDSSSHSLGLNPIEFTFKPRHKPVGISWVIHGPDGKEYTEDRMFL
jgi:hypothetical protein